MLELRNLHSLLAGPFDLFVAQGECIAITGPSGSGKSLFLRMIADLDPNQGEVLLNGRSRTSFAPPDWRRQITYNAAEPAWWSERTCDHFATSIHQAANALLPQLDLRADLFTAPVTQLSTGERQRMALIRTLTLESPVLLLDEATGALDEKSTMLVETLLARRLASGSAILMVTHNPAQAKRLGTRHYHMQQRRLIPAT